MRTTMWFNVCIERNDYPKHNKHRKVQVKTMHKDYGRKDRYTLVFMDETIKPEQWVKAEDVQIIPDRVAILPKEASSMIYAPQVLNPFQIYERIYQFVKVIAFNSRRNSLSDTWLIKSVEFLAELDKIDNTMFRQTKREQDLFLLEGIRF